MRFHSRMVESALACPSNESVRLVNKSGLPLDYDSIEKLWSRVRRKHPDGRTVESRIRNCVTLPSPPIPRPPVMTGPGGVSQKVTQLQHYLIQLEYNHTGMQYFEVRKNRPLTRLSEIAKDIMRESLPIKCLEAVVVAIYLLAPLEELKCFVIGFKSEFKSKTHRHVVLGVYANGMFGTVGLSRRSELMYKQMKYESLHDLLTEFIESYHKCGHSVLRVDLSIKISHDVHSCELIEWKFKTFFLKELTTEIFKRQIEKFSHFLRS